MRAYFMMLGFVALVGCAPIPGPAPTEQSAAEPVICGGEHGLACGAGEFCAFPQTGFCGVAGETGVCMPRPQACTARYNPVCGCDGQPYPTACAAAAAGVSVASLGECWQ